MAILTTKQTWRRQKHYRRPLERLTPEQQVNVRRVYKMTAALHGSHAALARALGVTPESLRRAQHKSRPPTPAQAYAIARLLDVGVDHVLAGRWHKVTCPCCGQAIVI